MLSRRRRTCNDFMANDLSFLNPELLAREAILRLLPRLVLSRLVVKNFDPTPALFGEVVKIKRPGRFTMTRKDGICDAIVVQDVTGDRIEARLDQWPQVAFKICDGESRSVPDLIEQELTPAVQALAEGTDLIVAGQVNRFVTGNTAGHLGQVSAANENVNDYILEAMDIMDANNVPDDSRILSLTGPTRTAGLKNSLFVRADQSGSQDALRRANLGQLYNFDLVNPSYQPRIRTGQPTTTAAVNNSGGHAVGTTAIVYDGIASGPFAAGEWITIFGDDTPQHITAVTTTGLTIAPGLKYAVADNAVITAIIPGAVNNAAGYRGRDTGTGVPGYSKEITIDGMTVAPRVGQGLTFGVGTDIYSVIGINGLVGITLDRPLETAIADNATVNLMPVGQYNMAFRPNAFALLVRPLAPAESGTGVASRTINYNGLSVRVTIGYDINTQAHKVVLDFLAGINTLDANQVVPMFG